MARLSRKRWREVCLATHGNKSAIAREFDKSRQWVYDRLKKDSYREIYEESLESSLDVAESQLMRHIHDPKDKAFKGEPWAIKFYLQTIGKNRGWTTRTELTGADGADLLGIRIDEDTLEILEKMGIPVEEATRVASDEFNEMIRDLFEKEQTKVQSENRK